jgi:hypothetical protein
MADSIEFDRSNRDLLISLKTTVENMDKKMDDLKDSVDKQITEVRSSLKERIEKLEATQKYIWMGIGLLYAVAPIITIVSIVWKLK